MATTTEEKKETEMQGASLPGNTNVSPDERTLLAITHALGIVTGFIGATVIFLIKTEVSDYAKAQIKEALNFQITMAIAAVVLSIFTFGFGGLVVGLANIVLCIIAAMAINEGKDYRYPFALRLLK